MWLLIHAGWKSIHGSTKRSRWHCGGILMVAQQRIAHVGREMAPDRLCDWLWEIKESCRVHHTEWCCNLMNLSRLKDTLTHWPLGIWLQSQISKFCTHFNEKYLKYFLWNCYQVNATTPQWSLVNISSGNGLVLSGNKPLPEPMLT